MTEYIRFLVPKALKDKAERMKEQGLNVSQILRNFLEAYPVDKKDEIVT